MEIKQIREELKALMDTVPRSNKDVIAAYKKFFPDADLSELEGEAPVVKLVQEEKEIWTYVGFGATPPPVIKFMGIQTFMRGTPTEVTDPRILAKIKGNKSFIKGEVNPDQLIAQDEAAAELVAEKQRRNAIIQMEEARRTAKLG